MLVALLASQTDGGTPAQEPPTILVQRLSGNEAAGDLVGGLSALLTERVKTADASFKIYSQADLERVVSEERQKQLVGCADESCLIELSDALGARYIISGRVDRFGDRYVLIANIYDKNEAKAGVQSRREVTDPGKLPAALDEVADEVLAPLGVKPRVDTNLANRLDTTGFTLGLKFSTQLVTSIQQLAPGGDLEIGYRITPAVQAFFQISFVTTFNTSQFGSTQLVPGILGARYYFRSGKSFQPYVGAALGLLVTIQSITSKGDTRPALWGHVGISYLFLPWLGVTTDFSVDVLGAAFELADTQKRGVNLALSLGALFRF